VLDEGMAGKPRFGSGPKPRKCVLTYRQRLHAYMLYDDLLTIQKANVHTRISS